jgi:transposase-like protein
MDEMNRNPKTRRHPAPLRPHPPELKERGYRLYEQGKSNHEIAEAIGIPVNTLARWSSKGKWKLRKQLAGCAEMTDNAPAAAEDCDEISQLSFEEKQRRYTEMMSNHALRVATVVKNLSSQALILNADKISKLDSVARKALNLEENKPMMVINVGLLASGRAPLIQANKTPARELQDRAPTDEKPGDAG